MIGPSLFEQTHIPKLEVEVAADAIRALDQEAAGRGVSYLAMAIVALEAAAKVRGKTAVHLEGDRLQ
jgi:hypothetical protein